MTYTEVGVGLPIVGPEAGPEAIAAVAIAADQLGFHAVSVFERLLLPAAPGWVNHAGLPDNPAYDALETLAWIAAKTEWVRLHTAILVPLFQQPVVLARRVATIDHLSGGRMDLGIAMGWLPEEFEATGVPARGRATAYEESVAALRACWGPDPVEFKGEHFTIPPAKIGPKPLDGLTLFGGGVARTAIERAARITDGLTLAFRDWDSCLEQIKWYRDAGGTGRIILRAGPMLPHPQQPEAATTFTEPAILDDLQHAADVGVHRVDWDLNIVGLSIPDQLDAFRTLAGRLGW
jgi:probable F420-dependent oxidoreductase